MPHYSVYFRTSAPLTIERWTTVLAALAGPVTTTYGELSGNPRDLFYQSVSITGRRGDVTFEVGLTEVLSTPGGSGTLMEDGTLNLTAASYAERTAIWEELQNALLPIAVHLR